MLRKMINILSEILWFTHRDVRGCSLQISRASTRNQKKYISS